MDPLAEIDRLNRALKYEENRSGRQGTHGPGCHLWGPSHYECLVREFTRWDHFTWAGEPEINSDDLEDLAVNWLGLEPGDPPQLIYMARRGPDAWLVQVNGEWKTFETEQEALNASR